MLQPKRQKHRKMHRGKMKGVALAGSDISFGDYALQAKECGWLSAREIEAARRSVTGYLKRKGKVWIRVFPDKPITKKPAEVKMGKGKGDVEGYVVVIRPGRIIFELAGVDEVSAKRAFELAGHKIGIPTRFIKSEGLL